MKDWQSNTVVGGKWSVTVMINNGNIVHEWGEYCVVNPPQIFMKTKQMNNNPFVGERQTYVTFCFIPSNFGTLITIREEGFIGLPQAAFGTAENWERVMNLLDHFLVHKNDNDNIRFRKNSSGRRK
ncbi:activator of Hsp90 ATPase-like protein [Thermoflavifilum aggregans]|uniref:Activator of Hsp90 ATPase-like protein n=1 Tax=Thermoflavifilum aggregans TaxID=454188 RepID=A0A2M9CWK2_9BACT|nr:activator of Hsp90 ATPase-like protein [Thermoflavifilum aggregans]